MAVAQPIMTSHAPGSVARPMQSGREMLVTPQQRIENRLKLVFAAQACLGGVVLGSTAGAEFIPIVAIFFAIFGYLFVDTVQLFALPPAAAYIAMGFVAIYSVGQFWNLEAPGQHQMIAVGELLVYVQSILMLQVKTRRIFEQLVIFSLLELIVAAVFNNAIFYGLMLIPMTILAIVSLCLLSALGIWDGVHAERQTKTSNHGGPAITTWSPSTSASFSASAMRFPRLAISMLSPAILLIGLIFFYALPRTGDARRQDPGGLALVGFDEELTLGQFGNLLQNSSIAMRIRLTNEDSIRPYRVNNGIYLRGRALENYMPSSSGEGRSAKWTSVGVTYRLGEKSIPPKFIEEPSIDSSAYDEVNVEIHCESMQRPSLFMIAPYHRDRTNPAVSIRHQVDSWTANRAETVGLSFPKINYKFGTRAFSGGEQLRFLTRLSHPRSALIDPAKQVGFTPEVQRIREMDRIDNTCVEYTELLLSMDRDAQPTAVAVAEQLANQMPVSKRSPYTLALAMESYLRDSDQFKYTLNLNSEEIPGVDTIEQFLSIYREGHCQYFASALVMMLRSQQIPARIVAGYHTDEFNELGGYYIARQLHAHAWVEALVPRSSIPKSMLDQDGYIAGQLPGDEYWMRLDPTPIANRENRSQSGGVGQVVDLAKNMWDEYVVDMDGKRQDQSLLGNAGSNSMSNSYASFIAYMQIQISRIRNGELGGGALSGQDRFSFPAALLGVGLVLLVFAAFRMKFPAWMSARSGRAGSVNVAEPSIAFYAEALRQLGRLGLHRSSGQTPAEFTDATSNNESNPRLALFAQPLSTLTSAFYRYRFGQNEDGEMPLALEPEIESALHALRSGVDDLTRANGSEGMAT